MRFPRLTSAVLAAGCALILAPVSAAASTTLLSEDFSGVTAGTYSGAIAGSVFSVSAGNVDILNPATFTCVDNPTGACVDLVGNVGIGGIASNTTFNLTAGDTYTIAFGAILQGFASDSSATTTFTIGLGGFLQSQVLGPNAQALTFSYTPSADETGQLIFNTTLAPDTVHGAVLDHIVLTETDGAASGAPEPAIWLTLSMGIGAIGATMRLGRRQAASRS
jgi:hypothetical protein